MKLFQRKLEQKREERVDPSEAVPRSNGHVIFHLPERSDHTIVPVVGRVDVQTRQMSRIKPTDLTNGSVIENSQKTLSQTTKRDTVWSKLSSLIRGESKRRDE
jgi:hypothetical protein